VKSTSAHTAITDTEICNIICQATGASQNSVLPSTHLRDDLGLDSVGLLSIAFIIETHTGIDAFAHAEAYIEAQRASDIIAIVQRRLLSHDE
jgi:acyl carrier protein